jgi:hypothetical protein
MRPLTPRTVLANRRELLPDLEPFRTSRVSQPQQPG